MSCQIVVIVFFFFVFSNDVIYVNSLTNDCNWFY